MYKTPFYKFSHIFESQLLPVSWTVDANKENWLVSTVDTEQNEDMLATYSLYIAIQLQIINLHTQFAFQLGHLGKPKIHQEWYTHLKLERNVAMYSYVLES